jgi:hypothetical protein
MDSRDDMNELNPQEGFAVNTNLQQPMGMDCQTNNETATSANGHVEQAALPASFDMEMAAEQQLAQDESRGVTEQPEVSLDNPAMLEKPEKRLELLRRDPSTMPRSQDHFAGQTLQLPEEAPPVELAVNAAQNDFAPRANKNLDTNSSVLQESMTNNSEHVVAEISTSSPPAATSESLRGNPYRLSGSLTAAEHAPENVDISGTIGSEVHQEQLEEPATLIKYRMQEDQDVHTDAASNNSYQGSSGDDTISDSESLLGPNHQASSAQHSRRNEKSDEYQSYDEHDCGDGDDGDDGDEDVWDDEHMQKLAANIRQQVQARTELEQRRGPLQGGTNFQTSHKDLRNGPADGQYEFQGFGAPPYAQQRPPQAFDGFAVHEPPFPGYKDMRAFQQHEMPYPAFRSPGQQLHQGTNGFMHRSRPMPPFFQGTPQYHQPYAAVHGQHNTGYQDPRYAIQPDSQRPPASAYTPSPMSSYEVQAQTSLPHLSQHWPSIFANTASRLHGRQQGLRKAPVVKEFDTSEDDEPLRTRVPRHPSGTSDSVIGSSPPQQVPATNNTQQDRDAESEVEFVAPKAKLGLKPLKEKKVALKQHTALSPAQVLDNAEKDLPSSISSIDWTLPKYEAQFEPGKTKNDPTVAKVSIPGIVREELLLSIEHAEQETHLLLHVFLPTQQRLESPDTHPALAILNFHTIAVMVIEAFVQFEIGDEMGTGRGHWHDDHDQGDADYQRLRDAKDADPDEIFFAVIDRWRAGLASNKEPSKLIRGTQEFCDIALDIIHYIRDNGLLKERQRTVKSDQGVKRGARKVENDSDVAEIKSKAVKRGSGKINEPKVTKKAKTSTKTKATPRTKATRKSRDKTSTLGVTVIRRK